MTVYEQQLAAQANPQFVEIANLLITQHKQNLSKQRRRHRRHQVSRQQNQQNLSQMTQSHQQQFLQTTIRHNREINQLHEKHLQETTQALSVASVICNVIDPNQIRLFLQRQQEQQQSQVNLRQSEHYREVLHLNNNHTQQMLDATTKQYDLQRRYEREQSSTIPPPGYGESRPSALPRDPSGYFDRLRKIDEEQVNTLLSRYGRRGEDAQPGLHETKPGYCCLLFGCKIYHVRGGGLLCASHKSLLFPIPTGHHLLGNELNFRGAGLALGTKLVVDDEKFGVSGPIPDMYRVTATAVEVYENDDIGHTKATDSRVGYQFQVGRDKYAFERVRRVSGKYIRSLRYLHRNRKENSIPRDVIVWFILLMRYTDFLGATGDIIALVSIGKANKSWYPKIQEYNSTFEGIVVGYQLYTNDDGSFRYKIVDYSSSRRIMRNLSPNASKFGKFHPPLHGKDECCANHLESCHFSVQCIIAMLLCVVVHVEDLDEDILMNFDSISEVLGITIDTESHSQALIDELCRRMRRNTSCREISFVRSCQYYDKSRGFWERTFSGVSIIEGNVVDNGEQEDSRPHHYSYEDMIFLTRLVDVMRNTDYDEISNPSDLREALVVRALYPHILRRDRLAATHMLELAVWKASMPPTMEDSDDVPLILRGAPLEWSAYPNRLADDNLQRDRIKLARQNYRDGSRINVVVTRVLEYLFSEEENIHYDLDGVA